MTDLAFATVAELSAGIGNGQLSPVEVVDALLARIARLDGQLHAFVAVHADQARLAAEGAHRAIRAGHRIGSLHGIPVALKDLVELEGQVTWCACRSPSAASSASRSPSGESAPHGVLPLAPTLDTPGPMARSVEDTALLYRVLAGPDPEDPATLALPPPVDPLPGLRTGVAGLRLAVLPAAERKPVEGDVLAAYDAAVETLTGLGARPVEVRLPLGF